MGYRSERPRKEKATYLVPNAPDESKLFSAVCGKVLVDFSIPTQSAGMIAVSSIGNPDSHSEYEVAVSDFIVTSDGLRAAAISMSQKSLPSKQFDLDEILESNMYKKTSGIDGLGRRGGSRFHIAYDRDGYGVGLVGNVRNTYILAGFVLLERFASKSGYGYGKTLARFGAGSYIQ